jgi:tetratricopeptide (TPR) repeat protein
MESRVGAYLGAGLVHLQNGDLPQAISRLEQALALSRDWNIESWFFWVLITSLGLAYALTGRGADGLRMVEDVVGKPSAMRIRGPSDIRLGEIHLLAGAPDEAKRIALAALEALASTTRYVRNSNLWDTSKVGTS